MQMGTFCAGFGRSSTATKLSRDQLARFAGTALVICTSVMLSCKPTDTDASARSAQVLVPPDIKLDVRLAPDRHRYGLPFRRVWTSQTISTNCNTERNLYSKMHLTDMSRHAMIALHAAASGDAIQVPVLIFTSLSGKARFLPGWVLFCQLMPNAPLFEIWIEGLLE